MRPIYRIYILHQANKQESLSSLFINPINLSIIQLLSSCVAILRSTPYHMRIARLPPSSIPIRSHCIHCRIRPGLGTFAASLSCGLTQVLNQFELHKTISPVLCSSIDVLGTKNDPIVNSELSSKYRYQVRLANID